MFDIVYQTSCSSPLSSQLPLLKYCFKYGRRSFGPLDSIRSHISALRPKRGGGHSSSVVFSGTPRGYARRHAPHAGRQVPLGTSLRITGRRLGSEPRKPRWNMQQFFSRATFEQWVIQPIVQLRRANVDFNVPGNLCDRYKHYARTCPLVLLCRRSAVIEVSVHVHVMCVCAQVCTYPFRYVNTYDCRLR